MKFAHAPRLLAPFLLLLSGFAWAQAAQPAGPAETAAPPVLKHLAVELIVFLRDGANSKATPIASIPVYGGRTLGEADLADQANPLDPAFYRLAPITKLKMGRQTGRLNAAGLRVLYHAGWIQPLNGTEVRLEDTENSGTFGGIIEAQNGSDAPSVRIDLAAGSPGEFFRVRQRQQIRLNTPVYFDHSRVGVIVMVSPIFETPPALQSAP